MNRLFVSRLSTPLGEFSALHDGDCLWRIHFATPEQDARSAGLVQLALPHWLEDPFKAYFAGELDALKAIPVQFEGTPFQRSVWLALREVPAGTTCSYSQLAQQVGKPRAVRAVGTANGANPVALVLPCHRIVASDGTLGGYSGGLHIKRWLLKHEGLVLPEKRKKGEMEAG